MKWLMLGLILVFIPMGSGDFFEKDPVTITEDEHWVFSFEIYEENGGVDQAVPVTVVTEYQSGPPVNFFVLDEENYGRFQLGEAFSVLQAQRNHDIRGTLASDLKMYDVGLYYLVWDNYDYVGQEYAMASSRFSYSIDSTDVVEAPGLGIVVAGLGLVGLVALRRRL